MKIIFFPMIISLLLACHTNDEITYNNELVGKWEFILFEVQDEAGNWFKIEIADSIKIGQAVILDFNENNTFIVSTPANTGRGKCFIDYHCQSIIIDRYGYTKAGETRWAYEFLKAMGSVTSYSFLNNTLFLYYNTSRLVFEEIK